MNAGRAPTKSQVPTNGGINKPIQKPKILQNATHILPKPPKDNPNEVIDQKAEAAKNSSVNEVTTSLENLVFSSTKAKIQAKLELRNDVPVRQISPQIVCISTKQKIELQTHPSKRDERQSSPTETNRVTPERSPSRGNSVVQSELTIDGRQPVIVISAQEDGVETFASQMESVQALVDDPDPRLLDALENPRDRLFVLKIEQEVVNFILTTSYVISTPYLLYMLISSRRCESLDTPPSNSYHRMLIHKIAEFYRLTHVASTESADCVKLYRGAAARMWVSFSSRNSDPNANDYDCSPTIRLSDLKTPNQTPSETLPSGPQQAVKIMRRALSGKGYSLEKSAGKGMSDPQSGDPSKPTTREEREAAYQLARARIFGDFKESPPETPSPTKSKHYHS